MTKPVIAVVAAGIMGAAIGQRLAEHGARVLTSLEGRSQATRARAEAAGMTAVSDDELAAADIILSVVPPGEAMALARRLAPALAAASPKPIFADCNAVDVATVERISGILTEGGARFVDGGIVGGPPRPGTPGACLYLSGPSAPDLRCLGALGLRIQILDGPVGAASALKMSYAGITKGLVAIAATMVLAAGRAGVAEALFDELAASQPQLLDRFRTALPDMYPKAHRWIAEMREISSFAGADDPGATIYEGCATLYERMARDQAAGGDLAATIDAFLARLRR